MREPGAGELRAVEGAKHRPAVPHEVYRHQPQLMCFLNSHHKSLARGWWPQKNLWRCGKTSLWPLQDE
jgi:hypothetical protein